MSDSTLIRNVGVPLGHFYLALCMIEKGLDRIEFNSLRANEELENHYEVLTEAIQHVLRLHGVENAYEIVKEQSRGEVLTQQTYLSMIYRLNHLYPQICWDDMMKWSPSANKKSKNSATKKDSSKKDSSKKESPKESPKRVNRPPRNTEATRKSLGVYLLPKLKEADAELFDFKPYTNNKGRESSYEKMCQSGYMPLVSDKKFGKTGVGQSYEYRGKFYACPEAICPEEGIPVSLKKLEIIERDTPNGPVRTALCPSCQKAGKEIYLLIRGEGSVYPGFLDPKRHPDGLCLPCCFKTDSMNETKPFYEKVKKCLSAAPPSANAKNNKK
jgi:hypothetical protein